MDAVIPSQGRVQVFSFDQALIWFFWLSEESSLLSLPEYQCFIQLKSVLIFYDGSGGEAGLCFKCHERTAGNSDTENGEKKE